MRPFQPEYDLHIYLGYQRRREEFDCLTVTATVHCSVTDPAETHPPGSPWHPDESTTSKSNHSGSVYKTYDVSA
ncbi:hypothetical protein TPCV302_22470 [Cutibacterium avidum]|nr:hypothetical protein TPCV302_22470 [Cutibacterium avidum]